MAAAPLLSQHFAGEAVLGAREGSAPRSACHLHMELMVPTDGLAPSAECKWLQERKEEQESAAQVGVSLAQEWEEEQASKADAARNPTLES